MRRGINQDTEKYRVEVSRRKKDKSEAAQLVQRLDLEQGLVKDQFFKQAQDGPGSEVSANRKVMWKQKLCGLSIRRERRRPEALHFARPGHINKSTGHKFFWWLSGTWIES
jgi:hypothetical protein